MLQITDVIVNIVIIITGINTSIPIPVTIITIAAIHYYYYYINFHHFLITLITVLVIKNFIILFILSVLYFSYLSLSFNQLSPSPSFSYLYTFLFWKCGYKHIQASKLGFSLYLSVCLSYCLFFVYQLNRVATISHDSCIVNYMCRKLNIFYW